MPSSISLIVVNYNGGGFLRACVSSALHQADELIVVDNASTDDSLTQIEAAFPAERKLRIIRNRENRGFAAANNAGVKASVGDYILFLNPDCVLTEGSLRRMVEVLNADPKVGMIGGLLVNPDGTEQGGRRRAVPTPWRSFVRAFGLSRFANRWLRLFCDVRLHQQPLPSHPIEVEAISCIAKTWTGACVSGRRSGRSCSFLMGVSSMTKGDAAVRGRYLSSGTNTKG